MFVASQDNGDHAAGFDGLLDAGGQVVGKAVDFGVRQAQVSEHDGGLLRVAGHVLPEEVEHGFMGIGFREGREEGVGLLPLPGQDIGQVGKRGGFFH